MLMLMLMLMLYFSSTWLCTCGFGQCVRGSLIGSHQDRQPPRAVMSYLAPVSYRTRTIRVPIMIPVRVPVWYSSYWCMTTTHGQIADRTDPTQVNMYERSRWQRSHPGKYVRSMKYLDHTHPNQANMCERSRSQIPSVNYYLDPADHIDPINQIWSRSRRSYGSHSANMCRSCRSYRSHPGKHVQKI